MNLCERLLVFKTALPPCCVKYHPQDPTILFISTYKLEDGKKTGSIDIYKHIDEPQLVKTFDTTAILDLKIQGDRIATAHSDGKVILWKFELEALELTQINQFQVFEETVTSVNFRDDKVVATCTDGSISILDLNDGSFEELPTRHDLECWISEFGELGEMSNVVFTGGDDSKLIAHDLRTQEMIWQTGPRFHDAGVVSILSAKPWWNTTNPNQLWTGSYDDNLRIMDLRLMDPQNPSLMAGWLPKTIQQENLGGGVWRLIPSGHDNRVLACCMYDGARIIDVKDDKFEVTKYFKRDHESMCYGGDWKSNIVTTCSFYDHVVQVWDPETSINM